MNKKFVGVYGTLRQGERANSMMSECLFIAKVSVKLRAMMVHLGGFPGIIPSEEENEIVFEIYQLPQDERLCNTVEKRLDSYEGYPSLYIKNTFDIDIDNVNDGEKMTVTYYQLNRHGSSYVKIEDGDWVNSKNM